ncbi:hypothetical protein BDR26DRAFT_881545 [Obelidium mucronatum]|nr:hypothetical protein BDR26DRAFT_881545 [Obelidium mucronatum]
MCVWVSIFVNLWCGVNANITRVAQNVAQLRWNLRKSTASSFMCSPFLIKFFQLPRIPPFLLFVQLSPISTKTKIIDQELTRLLKLASLYEWPSHYFF